MANRVIVGNKEDRLALASILIKNGYTVRIVKDTVNGKKADVVEYWRDSNERTQTN